MTHLGRVGGLCLGILVAVGMAWVPGAAHGQGQAQPAVQVEPDVAPRTFGPADEVAVVVHATEFVAFLEGPTAGIDNRTVFSPPNPSGGVIRAQDPDFGVGFTTFWMAGVHVPAGAQITRIQLSACDGSNTRELTFALMRSNEPAFTGNEFVTAVATTGAAATPNCALFTTPVTAAVTIDNTTKLYTLVLTTNGNETLGINFSAVRVFYRLNVSPAPATATFGDVPTSHPFFRFVEALVKSGITAGCGGGNYCPDDPLTRGQMAVFLSTGLGLHFAP